jgi:hypothetical protein
MSLALLSLSNTFHGLLHRVVAQSTRQDWSTAGKPPWQESMTPAAKTSMPPTEEPHCSHTSSPELRTRTSS